MAIQRQPSLNTTLLVRVYPRYSDISESHLTADLTNVTASIPKLNFLIVMGDFSAHLALTPENKYTYRDKINLNE